MQPTKTFFIDGGMEFGSDPEPQVVAVTAVALGGGAAFPLGQEHHVGDGRPIATIIFGITSGVEDFPVMTALPDFPMAIEVDSELIEIRGDVAVFAGNMSRRLTCSGVTGEETKTESTLVEKIKIILGRNQEG